MKVRWTRNSVRLRITPSELAALQRGEAVREELILAQSNGWSASIEPDSALTDIRLESGALRFLLAASDLEHLAEPEVEGIYFQTQGATTVRYFIEKDFPCIHPRAAEVQEAPGETFNPPTDFAQPKESNEAED